MNYTQASGTTHAEVIKYLFNKLRRFSWVSLNQNQSNLPWQITPKAVLPINQSELEANRIHVDSAKRARLFTIHKEKPIATPFGNSVRLDFSFNEFYLERLQRRKNWYKMWNW